MHNPFDDKSFRLQEFAEYLLRNHIAREGHARYYVFWVRRFLEKEIPDPKLTLSDRLDQFLLGLQAEHRYADWQIEQAERAIRLYYFKFRNNAENGGRGPSALLRTGRPPSIDCMVGQVIANGGGPPAPAAALGDQSIRGGRGPSALLRTGRPPSTECMDVQRITYVGGPPAPAAVTPRHPNRLNPAHPQPLDRFNEPVVLLVTACAKNRGQLFNNKPAHEALLDAWKNSIQWRVGLYLLMPDHVHLFCVPGVEDPESVSDWAAYWKRLSGLRESCLTGVWQRDVWDTQMRTLAHYEEKLSYVRMNPVRKGLASRPEEWPFSGTVNNIFW